MEKKRKKRILNDGVMVEREYLRSVVKTTRGFFMQAKFIAFILQAIAMHYSHEGSFGTLPSPILKKYWTGKRAIWCFMFHPFSSWTEGLSPVSNLSG